MKEVLTVIVVAMLILATLFALWMDWFTKPAAEAARTTQPECIEYSRDGSYCFRQPIE